MLITVDGNHTVLKIGPIQRFIVADASQKKDAEKALAEVRKSGRFSKISDVVDAVRDTLTTKAQECDS
jgi:hypothetical protein